MAKKAYIGVDGVARKIKKGYVGVDGKARKIKKTYIGIGGVARPCWSGGELAYYGKITDLSVGRQGLTATSVGNYALFGGGFNAGYKTTVDAYNRSLVRSTPTALSAGRRYFAATPVGDYALFAGGYTGTSTSSKVVDAYNTSLSRSTPTTLSVVMHDHAATSVGDYAIFAGSSTTVNTYNTSLTRSELTGSKGLSANSPYLAAATIGNYAIFYGGSGSIANFYNTSLTRTTGSAYQRYWNKGASNSKYAVFVGGYQANASAASDVVAYDSSLTRAGTTNGVNQAHLAGTGVGDYAIFGGGWYGTTADPTVCSYVYSIDTSLTRKSEQSLTQKCQDNAATSIGDYALFGGGSNVVYSSTQYYSSVDVFTVS